MGCPCQEMNGAKDKSRRFLSSTVAFVVTIIFRYVSLSGLACTEINLAILFSQKSYSRCLRNINIKMIIIILNFSIRPIDQFEYFVQRSGVLLAEWVIINNGDYLQCKFCIVSYTQNDDRLHRSVTQDDWSIARCIRNSNAFFISTGVKSSKSTSVWNISNDSATFIIITAYLFLLFW